MRKELPEKTIWAFSGFTWEELNTAGSHPCCEVTPELLSLLDVLVDGRFQQALYDISLRFAAPPTSASLMCQKRCKAAISCCGRTETS